MIIRFRKDNTWRKYPPLNLRDGETAEVPDKQGQELIKGLPDNFEEVDQQGERIFKPLPGTPRPIMPGNVIIRFKRTPNKKAHGSRGIFLKDGQIAEISPENANHCMTHWPDNFEIVSGSWSFPLPPSPNLPAIRPEPRTKNKRTLFCPSLSISREVLEVRTEPQPKYDVALGGHAYPSRVEFIQNLLKLKPRFTMLLIGDGWKKNGLEAETLATQTETETMKLYRSARIVVCLHRDESDLGGFPVMVPKSIHRGYIEAYSGRLVMIDRKRSEHSFGDGEVVFFDSPKDLKQKIEYYLAHYEEAKQMAMKAKARAERDFTFRARLTKILNCVRSERYNMEIP